MTENKYLPIIGLEIHAELKTRSKMFCSCSADYLRVPTSKEGSSLSEGSYFGHKPNTHVCPVCLGLPGALPVPNKQAIEWCVMLGMALNCQIPAFSKFDRKNYFYPDLPKGYQISQYDLPFCVGGEVVIATPSETRGKQSQSKEQEIATGRILDPRNDRKTIRIRRVHMEEDTAKLVHQFGMSNGNYTLIDFNRSGVPLVEIVTEPDIRSAQEAKLFLQKLQQIIRYLGISDCDMEKGSMRLEPNISLLSLRGEKEKNDEAISKRSPLRQLADRDDTTGLPSYKVEVKNINSFRFVEKAIEYEVKRQTEILEKGGIPTQETRGFDERKMATFPQRGKEEAQDYRYFPEPDIPPVRWTEAQISNVKCQIPELPDAKSSRFMKDYGLSEYDANILTTTLPQADYFEEAIKVNEKLKMKNEKCTEIKTIANWIINKRVDIEKTLPAKLIQMILQKGQTQTMSEEELNRIIDQVLLDNPKAVSDYKSGKISAVMFLVGQVMSATKGTAKAEIIKKLLEEKL